MDSDQIIHLVTVDDQRTLSVANFFIVFAGRFSPWTRLSIWLYIVMILVPDNQPAIAMQQFIPDPMLLLGPAANPVLRIGMAGFSE